MAVKCGISTISQILLFQVLEGAYLSPQLMIRTEPCLRYNDYHNFARNLTASDCASCSPLRIRGCMFDANTGLGTWALVPVNPTKL